MFHESGYKPNAYTPIVHARQLCDYVFTITDNKNKFPEYEVTERKDEESNTVRQVITLREDAVLNRVRQQAFDVYILAFTANKINLKREPERKDERLGKQKKAIELCDILLGSMELCCLKYGASKKRMMHWGNMIVEVREELKDWHRSDIDRYAGI